MESERVFAGQRTRESHWGTRDERVLQWFQLQKVGQESTTDDDTIDYRVPQMTVLSKEIRSCFNQ